MKHITAIKNKKFKWIIIDKPSKKSIDWLGSNFKFAKQDLNDCLPPTQRPKLIDRGDYLFMILLFPFYNRQKKEIQASEIDLFINNEYVILIHNNNLMPILEFQQECETNAIAREMFMADGSKLIYELLNRLLHYCFPMLNHINQDIDEIEAEILDVHKGKTHIIYEILFIKRNIVNFRKIMQSHKSVMSKLIKTSEKFFPPEYLQNYFINLVNHTKDIWDFLENYKDTINALHSTHESLLSNRLNQIIKTLTIFSVIVFPLTLLAAIFGMNTMNSMPFVDSPHDFWLVVGVMGVGTVAMLIFFKVKRWL